MKKTEKFEHTDSRNRGERHGRLHAAAGADPEAVDSGEEGQRGGGDERIAEGGMRELQEVAREGDRHSGHAACLNHQKQDPAIKKCDARMKRFAEVSVLAADDGQARGEFGVNEATEKSNHTAGDPNRQDEERSVD